MKRPHRNEDGTYHIHGKHYKELFGSRHQVWNKTAYKTSGNLTRKHLLMNKWGRIVSNKKHFTAKREKRLQKYGYYAKKGKFGYVKKNGTQKRKTRGGDLFDSFRSKEQIDAREANRKRDKDREDQLKDNEKPNPFNNCSARERMV